MREKLRDHGSCNSGHTAYTCLQDYDGVIDGKDLNIAGNALYWHNNGKTVNIGDRCSRYDCNKDKVFNEADVSCVESYVE